MILHPLIPCGNQLVPSMALVALVLLQRLPSLAGRQCPLHRRASPAAHVIPFRRHQTPTVAVLHGPAAGTVELHPFVQVHGNHAGRRDGAGRPGLFEPQQDQCQNGAAALTKMIACPQRFHALKTGQQRTCSAYVYIYIFVERFKILAQFSDGSNSIF